MKKVLILSYYFPPYEFTGGQRPYSWYKFFKKNNIYPVVVTRHWDQNIKSTFDSIKASSNQKVEIHEDNYGTIIRVPFNPDLRDKYHLQKRNAVIRRAFNFFNKIRFFSLKNDKTAKIYLEADRYLKENKIDLIIATGAPFIIFRYAYLLSTKHKIPWIADYRDGWSTNASLLYSGFIKKTAYKFALGIIEKKYVKTAIAITLTEDPCQKLIQALFPNKRTYVIYNGYNPELIRKNNDSSTTNFTIGYAGVIYPFQELELFLEGFKKFTEAVKDDNVRLTFYGVNHDKKTMKRINKYDLSINKYIISTELFGKEKVMRKLSSAHALLLLSSRKVETLASKLFDYMALDKRIILVPHDSSIMSKIIEECSAGVFCSTPNEIKNELVLLYKEFKKTGTVVSHVKNFEEYKWENQVEKMSKIIHGLT